MSVLPRTAFIHPDGDNRAEIESLFQKTLALLLDEMTQARGRSPLPGDDNLAQNEALIHWAKIPEQPVDFDDLLVRLRSHIRQSMNVAHPGYIGHMDSMPTTASIMGDWLAAALNNNMLSVEMSPVFSRLEPLVLQQIAQRFGLGVGSGGVMVSGGSLANLQALTVARNIAFDAVNRGIVGLTRRPVFFVSEVAHTSMQKAAMLMGLGADAAIAIRTNANSQIDIEDLKAKLSQSESLEQQPFAIVATAGTTVTGNIDPIGEIARIAKKHQLWFHVDAAYGGSLIFSKAHRYRLAGIDQADSVTFNPQKWLYIAKTCATVLFKKIDLLKAHFRIAAPYMGDDPQWNNLGELSVQGTRHADILKLWLSLQHVGTAGYSEIIDHNYVIAAHFTEAVRSRPYLRLASEPEMNLVCFRLEPKGTDSHQQDSLNADLQRYLLKPEDAADYSDAVFLSLPTYRAQRWLKAVLLNPYTSSGQIDTFFARIDAFVSSCL